MAGERAKDPHSDAIAVDNKAISFITAQTEEPGKTIREFEYSENDTISVMGRLKQNSTFWKNCLHTSPFVQSIIDEGYRIPFENDFPPSFYAPNNKSSLRNKSFVDKAVNDLLAKGAILEVTDIPFCCNPLTVSEKKNKLRLVLDLRHVNKYVKHTKFKYDDLKVVSQMFNQNDFFITFDLNCFSTK